jgi:hypothetical protein
VVVEGGSRWRCCGDDEENWQREKVLLLEEKEAIVTEGL